MKVNFMLSCFIGIRSRLDETAWGGAADSEPTEEGAGGLASSEQRHREESQEETRSGRQDKYVSLHTTKSRKITYKGRSSLYFLV